MSRSVYDRTGPIPRWDEGLPLGNGLLGCLVWGTAQALNFSLDLSGLWDETPAPGVQAAGFSFDGLRTMVEERQWDRIRQVFDLPYDDPAPTKLPAGRLVLRGLGEPSHSRYSLRAACGSLTFKKGQLTAWVHATAPVGIVRLEDVHDGWTMDLLPPAFAGGGAEAESCVGEKALSVLGYPAAERFASRNTVGFAQRFPGGAFAAAAVRREQQGGTVLYFSVARAASVRDAWGKAKETVENAAVEALPALLREHWRWWSAFWRKSSLRLPSGKLEKAWNFANYALACCSRPGGAPCSLQGVWTADNGLLPPWKGDYHNDLNTQLIYSHYGTANHLEEGRVLFDHLRALLPQAQRFARAFYGLEGGCYPGVMSLSGQPLGGWPMYSLSPTNQVWLGQMAYRHFGFTGDAAFLRQTVYPICRQAGKLLAGLLRRKEGWLFLPLSSSPEIHENAPEAWLTPNSNYDLALMRWLFAALPQIERQLGLPPDPLWAETLEGLPELAVDKDGRLLLAPGEPLAMSHRHFSHTVAIYPLGLLRASDPQQLQVMRRTVEQIERLGTDEWAGFSFAWMALLQALCRNGDKAEAYLDRFLDGFVGPNGFHLNGDYKQRGYSRFSYRPFTLEGNFLAAEAIQQMLLQTEADTFTVLPAIPTAWKRRMISAFDLLTDNGLKVSIAKGIGDHVIVRCQAQRDGSWLFADLGQRFALRQGQVMSFDFYIR